jgi:CheY-like chemotaxis protein
MDGYEATRSIRALENEQNQQHTPILAVSAHSYKSDLESCKKCGMDGYATKPILFARLRRMLEDAWELRTNGRLWETTHGKGDAIAGWFDREE